MPSSRVAAAQGPGVCASACSAGAFRCPALLLSARPPRCHAPPWRALLGWPLAPALLSAVLLAACAPALVHRCVTGNHLGVAFAAATTITVGLVLEEYRVFAFGGNRQKVYPVSDKRLVWLSRFGCAKFVFAALIAMSHTLVVSATDPAFNTVTVAGSACLDGTGTYAGFNGPSGVTVDQLGNVYVADTYNYAIRRIAV